MREGRSQPNASICGIDARIAARPTIADVSGLRSSSWRAEVGDLPQPKSRFLLVRCPDCGNEQTIFDHASTKVTCLVCGATIVHPKGGKAEIKGEFVKVVE
jgi:small subunit ribosomal protein S27e